MTSRCSFSTEQAKVSLECSVSVLERDLSLTQLEFEWVVAVPAGIEFLATGQRACVMHLQPIMSGRLVPLCIS